ncbi:hypothetical protein BGZ89_002865 [Linnemannia elongata]|nr:hypothetical protein BGZ89_002865 [Linnemannia elongata]
MASPNPPNGDTIEKAPKIDFDEPLKMTRTKTIPVEGSSTSAAEQPAPINEKSVGQPDGADKGKKAGIKDKTLDIMRVCIRDDTIS